MPADARGDRGRDLPGVEVVELAARRHELRDEVERRRPERAAELVGLRRDVGAEEPADEVEVDEPVVVDAAPGRR